MDSGRVAQTELASPQSVVAVQRGTHTGSPPLRRTQAAVPGHSLEVAAGVLQRLVQKRMERPEGAVLERQRRVSPEQLISREQAW